MEFKTTQQNQNGYCLENEDQNDQSLMDIEDNKMNNSDNFKEFRNAQVLINNSSSEHCNTNQCSNDNQNENKEHKLNKCYSKKNANTAKTENRIQLSGFRDIYIPRGISDFQNCFILAGGIAFERNGLRNDENILEHLKSIRHTTKYNNGSLQIDVEGSGTIKEYGQIIEFLQKTQNQEDYTLSQKLISIQQHLMGKINIAISQIKSQMNSDELHTIIMKRSDYFKDIQQHFYSTQIKEDDFSHTASIQINWGLEVVTYSSFYLSKGLIALLGSENEAMITNIMRRGLSQVFTSHSRRKILDYQIQSYLKSNQTDEIFEIPDIEFITIDNILINCTAQLRSIRVQYPPHLQLADNNNSQLNNIESISALKFNITQHHLESILNIRQKNIIANSNHSSSSSHRQNYSDIENTLFISNFEYYIQSECFLQNYYKEKYQQDLKEKQKYLKTCSYRSITNY